jgi:hypothetical protein
MVWKRQKYLLEVSPAFEMLGTLITLDKSAACFIPLLNGTSIVSFGAHSVSDETACRADWCRKTGKAEIYTSTTSHAQAQNISTGS